MTSLNTFAGDDLGHDYEISRIIFPSALLCPRSCLHRLSNRASVSSVESKMHICVNVEPAHNPMPIQKTHTSLTFFNSSRRGRCRLWIAIVDCGPGITGGWSASRKLRRRGFEEVGRICIDKSAWDHFSARESGRIVDSCAFIGTHYGSCPLVIQWSG